MGFIFGSQEGNTTPIAIKIPNWGRAWVQIVGLKCDLCLVVKKAIQHP